MPGGRLDFPIVSGNVSLYNETNGEAIYPTPAIGGVGLLPNIDQRCDLAFKQDGDVILVVGETKGHLGASIWARENGVEIGAPPPVDLDAERSNGDFVRGLIHDGTVSAVHDVSDGGLLVAVAEMAMAGGIGAKINASADHTHAYLLGEDQARYIVTASANYADVIVKDAKAANIPIETLGIVAGEEILINDRDPVAVRALRAAHENWLPDYMGGPA